MFNAKVFLFLVICALPALGERNHTPTAPPEAREGRANRGAAPEAEIVPFELANDGNLLLSHDFFKEVSFSKFPEKGDDESYFGSGYGKHENIRIVFPDLKNRSAWERIEPKKDVGALFNGLYYGSDSVTFRAKPGAGEKDLVRIYRSVIDLRTKKIVEEEKLVGTVKELKVRFGKDQTFLAGETPKFSPDSYHGNHTEMYCEGTKTRYKIDRRLFPEYPEGPANFRTPIGMKVESSTVETTQSREPDYPWTVTSSATIK